MESLVDSRRHFVVLRAICFASYSLGDSGDAVKDLQRRLTQAGCLVRADGRFNETTVSAVKKFQKKHNLDVDGVVGPVTYKALTGKTLKSKKHSSARKIKCHRAA